MKVERITIPIYGNRISPLFDVAGRFEVIDLVNREIGERFHLDTSKDSGIVRIEKLKNHSVNTVICSAISRIYANYIIRWGINLIPGVIGSVDDVIYAYMNNNLLVDLYAMPGCRWRRRFRGGLCPNYSEIFFNKNGTRRRR